MKTIDLSAFGLPVGRLLARQESPSRARDQAGVTQLLGLDEIKETIGRP